MTLSDCCLEFCCELTNESSKHSQLTPSLQQFGGGFPGPNCFKTITMTYNGKSTQATIMDEVRQTRSTRPSLHPICSALAVPTVVWTCPEVFLLSSLRKA